MCKTHKRYVLQLYIWNQISLYGINGFVLGKQFITWAIFMEELIAHYEDTKSNTFYGQLISLKQKGSIMEHIDEFQKLNIRVKIFQRSIGLMCSYGF